jgi:hypothetical protein
MTQRLHRQLSIDNINAHILTVLREHSSCRICDFNGHVQTDKFRCGVLKKIELIGTAKEICHSTRTR